MIFILSSISTCLEFWSVNHTSMNENSELNVFKNINFLRKKSSNMRNNFLEINVYNSWILLINVDNLADNNAMELFY